MKKSGVVILGFVLLLAVGVGAWFMWGMPKTPSASQETQVDSTAPTVKLGITSAALDNAKLKIA